MSIHTKLIEFHKQFNGAQKTGVNPHFNSQHFTLDDVIRATTPILNNLGMYVTHYVNDGALVTMVADEEGDKIESHFPLTVNGNPQANMSQMTYGKRGNMCALLNIAEADDDGNAATAEAIKPISQDRAASIRDELEMLGRDEAKFCQYLGVNSLEDMPTSKLPEAERAMKQAHEALGK